MYSPFPDLLFDRYPTSYICENLYLPEAGFRILPDPEPGFQVHSLLCLNSPKWQGESTGILTGLGMEKMH